MRVFVFLSVTDNLTEKNWRRDLQREDSPPIFSRQVICRRSFLFILIPYTYLAIIPSASSNFIERIFETESIPTVTP
jgi:hypothetical protein